MSKLDDLTLVFGITVTCTAGDNPCIHIKDSHLVDTKDAIKMALRHIHRTDEYKALVEAGYNRTFDSEYREWVGHNTLYRWGFMRDSTRSVDIDNNEPKWRRALYSVLSAF